MKTSVAYEESLAAFCIQSAVVIQIKDVLKRTGKCSWFLKRRLAKALRILSLAKAALLEEKEKLGYTDELAFTEDCLFNQFKLVNGELEGDTSLLPDIANSMYFSKKNNYQYEVANFLLALYCKKRRK